MKRRLFLATAAALAIALPGLSRAADTVDYSPGLIAQALADGKTVFVDYAADWCSTCARQERVISALRAANPAYDEAMLFVRVDWDDYKRHKVTTSRKIPRRSTLVLLRGDKELGRIVAGTGEAEIRTLMEKGLSGAS
ncbi:thioredoxin family protein [Halovulum sp. GXIMD14793]